VQKLAGEESARLGKTVDVDWGFVNSFILKQEAAGSPVGPADLLADSLPERYNQVISDNLDRKQELIEHDQLTQSSVLQDAATPDPKMLWLRQLQSGR